MITQFTSASASKYLKSLQEEKDFLLDAERKIAPTTALSTKKLRLPNILTRRLG